MLRVHHGHVSLEKQHQPILEQVVDVIVEKNLSEFSVSQEWSPDFFSELCYNGFLCICQKERQLRSPSYILLPKLHYNRACFDLSQRVHASKSTLKRVKRQGFTFSIDTAFDLVMTGCLKQHGESWLHPPMRSVLEHLHRNPTKRTAVHSIEVWAGDELVAGEIGYSCGAVYTSMTGFAERSFDGCGSAQLVATGALLRHCGFRLWDLGMMLPYKAELGCLPLSRSDFVSRLRSHRDASVSLKLPVSLHPRATVLAVLDLPPHDTAPPGSTSPRPAPTVGTEELSKSQQKKLQKKQYKMEQKQKRKAPKLEDSGDRTPGDAMR